MTLEEENGIEEKEKVEKDKEEVKEETKEKEEQNEDGKEEEKEEGRKRKMKRKRKCKSKRKSKKKIKMQKHRFPIHIDEEFTAFCVTSKPTCLSTEDYYTQHQLMALD